MLKTFISLCAILIILSGCAVRVDYEPASFSSMSEAQEIIEQVSFEQKQSLRPEVVVLTDTYIGFGDGRSYQGSDVTVGNSSGYAQTIGQTTFANASGSSVSFSSGHAKDVNTRVYFNSMDEIQLYTKRSWYIVQIVSHEGGLLRRFYTRNETKAHKLVDALTFLQGQA